MLEFGRCRLAVRNEVECGEWNAGFVGVVFHHALAGLERVVGAGSAYDIRVKVCAGYLAIAAWAVFCADGCVGCGVRVCVAAEPQGWLACEHGVGIEV